MYLAQNIKYLREHKGEMQKDIAELLSVSKQTASVYEKGEIEPDIAKLIMLADHFEITIDELVRKDLRPPKPMYAKNLKYLREKAGLKQSDIADLLQVKQSTIALYEINKRNMDVADLVKVADFFGVTMDQMIKRDLSEVDVCKDR